MNTVQYCIVMCLYAIQPKEESTDEIKRFRQKREGMNPLQDGSPITNVGEDGKGGNSGDDGEGDA